MSNICIVTSSFPAGKKEIYHLFIDDLIELLYKNGHSVTVLSQDKRCEKEKFHDNIDLIWFPWKYANKNILSEVSLKSVRNIFSVISLIYNGVKYSRKTTEQKKIDLFICLWIVPSGFYIYLKNIFSPKTPYILWSLGSDVYNYKDNFFTRFILKSVIKKSRAVFADGFELCEIIHNISGRECQFLPTFHKLNITENLNFNPDKDSDRISFLYVGRLSLVKGVDILVNAFNLLKYEYIVRKYSCSIIGDGEMTEELQAVVKKKGLDNIITFHGRIVDEKKLAQYYQKSDCIIIPSRSESIPVVLGEAIQFCKPVIVSDTGDMKYIVEKHTAGLVFQKENAGNLSNVLKIFIASPLRLSKESQVKVMKELSFIENSDKLVNAISK